MVGLEELQRERSERQPQSLCVQLNCRLCGYQWERRQSEPEPQGPAGGVNQHLIAYGEDLLRRQQSQEDEEDARRKAVAEHYAEWQKSRTVQRISIGCSLDPLPLALPNPLQY